MEEAGIKRSFLLVLCLLSPVLLSGCLDEDAMQERLDAAYLNGYEDAMKEWSDTAYWDGYKDGYSDGEFVFGGRIEEADTYLADALAEIDGIDMRGLPDDQREQLESAIGAIKQAVDCLEKEE